MTKYTDDDIDHIKSVAQFDNKNPAESAELINQSEKLRKIFFNILMERESLFLLMIESSIDIACKNASERALYNAKKSDYFNNFIKLILTSDEYFKLIFKHLFCGKKLLSEKCVMKIPLFLESDYDDFQDTKIFLLYFGEGKYQSYFTTRIKGITLSKKSEVFQFLSFLNEEKKDFILKNNPIVFKMILKEFKEMRDFSLFFDHCSFNYEDFFLDYLSRSTIFRLIENFKLSESFLLETIKRNLLTSDEILFILKKYSNKKIIVEINKNYIFNIEQIRLIEEIYGRNVLQEIKDDGKELKNF
tara:strand:- start:340 stop:1245 length:906 start_codon:yes stop_codon:yes gene_type:complete